VSFPAFKLLTVDDIVNAVRQLPDKFSSVDPLLTSTLKQAVDLLAPFIVEVFNHLLARSHFPTCFKKAFITAMVKKPGIDDRRLILPADLEPASAVESPRAHRRPPAHGLPAVCRPAASQPEQI